MRLPPQTSCPWLVGVSGGADSVSLLCRCKAAGVPVEAAHFNHRFADENGNEAEAFVRQLCAEQGVTLHVGSPQTPQGERETKEVYARRERFAFFGRLLREATPPHAGLLLAHQADDRAENLILRLARGSGAEGLTSFGWQAVVPGAPEWPLLRPLLDETHAEQEAWLKAHGIAWVEDVSNGDQTIPRNAIRHTLVPVLPHFTAGVNASADLLLEEHAFLQSLAQAAIMQQTADSLEVKPNTPTVLLRRLLRQWAPEATSRKHLETLCALPLGEIANLSQGTRVKRCSPTCWLRLSPCPPPKRPS